MNRVKVGKQYRYNPVAWDVLMPPVGSIKAGDVVTVVNLRGCPPANTMGHCYVNGPNGKFGGLVMTSSLDPL